MKTLRSLSIAILFLGGICHAQLTGTAFETPGTTTYVVPAGVTQLKVKLWGAGGGQSSANPAGGGGAFVTGILNVTPGETLQVLVGGGGGPGVNNVPGAGGINGGGAGGIGQGIAASGNPFFAASGGGGRSALQRMVGTDLVVAGGGGGGGGGATLSATPADGGAGGLGTGAAGTIGTDTLTTSGGGSGGTQVAGGAGGIGDVSGSAGILQTGGAGGSSEGPGGGGGGGYFGGGGGAASNTPESTLDPRGGGGGGGSSLLANLVAGTTTGSEAGTGKIAGGGADVDYVQSVGVGGGHPRPFRLRKGGDGRVVLIPIPPTATPGQVVYGSANASSVYRVPAGVTELTVKLWGAGGGGGGATGGVGGGGAFVTGKLAVTPGELLIVRPATAGQGGTSSAPDTAAYGGQPGGGFGGFNLDISIGAFTTGGGGGGRTVLQRIEQTDLVTAAGGGGGAGKNGTVAVVAAAGAGGLSTGAPGGNGASPVTGGSGGTLVSGGNAGTSTGSTFPFFPSGSLGIGGNGDQVSRDPFAAGGSGGGGGAGFFGGGAGGGYYGASGLNSSGGAGGGGSSLLSNLTSTVGSAAGSGPTPGGAGDANYAAGVGIGGGVSAAGGGGRVVIIPATPTTTFTDTFTTGDGTGVANGNLHGNQVEVGTAVWQAEAAYFYSATNRAENDPTRLPLTSVDSRIAYLNTPLAAGEAITVEADVSPPFGNAVANVWTAIGFANNPASLSGSGFFSPGVGQVWILLAKDGSWNAFANATAIALGSGAAGTAPGFVVGMNHLKLQYDSATNKASAWINGAQVLNNVSLGAFTPAITATGFQTFRKEQAAVDNFSVTFGQNSQPTPVQTTFGDVISGAGAPNAGGTDSGADFDILKRGGFIAENGNLVFPGQLLINGTTVTLSPNNFMGLWKHDGASLKLFSRSGNLAPEASGALFDVLPQLPAINDSGEVTFLGSLVVGSGAPATTVGNDTGLWSELGGTGLGILIREGDTIPGLSPVQVGAFASGAYATAHTGASTGEATFSITMKNGSTDTAILRASITGAAVTAVGIVARENMEMPGIPGEFFGNLAGSYSDPQRMDATGNVVFAALSKTNKESIWYQPVAPAGGPAAKVFKVNDTAPDTGGARFQSFKSPTIGSSGVITFRGFLLANTGDNTFGLSNDGIWRGTGSTAASYTCILRRGDNNASRAGLGLPNAADRVGNLWHSWLTNANHGAWKGWLDVSGNGTSSTADGDVNAIYTDLSGTMTMKLKVGDIAPGMGGVATFASFDLPVVGGAEQLAFIGNVIGGGTTAANNSGIWRSAASGGALTLVIRTGDTITTTQGARIIQKVDFPGSGSTDRRWEQPVMDATGRLIVYVTFTAASGGGTSQILVP